MRHLSLSLSCYLSFSCSLCLCECVCVCVYVCVCVCVIFVCLQSVTVFTSLPLVMCLLYKKTSALSQSSWSIWTVQGYCQYCCDVNLFCVL